MIGRKDRHHGIVHRRARLALPAGQELHEIFELAEGPRRLGKLGIARPHRRHRSLVAIGAEHQEVLEIGEGLGGHGGSRIRMLECFQQKFDTTLRFGSVIKQRLGAIERFEETRKCSRRGVLVGQAEEKRN